MTTTIGAIDLPFDEAIAYLRAKANVTSESYTDIWGKANVKSFTVAGATTQALVGDFRAEVAKALEKGTSLQEFRKSFDGIVAKHGWEHNGTPGWRSRIIYETNLGMAYSAGRYAQQTEPETLAAFPYWQYVHSGALHPRLQHKAWNGLTLRADDPFWQTHYPPNGWRCGCRTRPVSGRGLQRMGKSGPDTAPPLKLKEYTNRKTGEVYEVPEGIDPGFDYNVGQEWTGKAPQIPANATLVPRRIVDPPAPASVRPKQKTLPFDPPLSSVTAPPRLSLPVRPAPSPKANGWPWTPQPRRSRFDMTISPSAYDFGLFKTEAEARALAAELMAGVPEELKVKGAWEWERYSSRLRFSVVHRDVTLSRSFWRTAGNELMVEHDYFKLAGRFQGGGHAVRMLQTSYAAYDRLGVSTVHVHANLDKGGYVWARNGFAARYPDEMREELRAAAELLDDARAKTLRDVIGTANDRDLMYDVSLLRDAQGDWGKSLLLGSDWFGFADLTDPEQRALLAKALKR